MSKNLLRSISRGDKGPDVLAVKRALKKAGYKRGLAFNRRFGGALDRELRKFQKSQLLATDGVYGEVTHKYLSPFVDDYGWKLFSQAPTSTPEEEAYNRLISYMEKMTRDTPGYIYGGGHGVPLRNLSTHQGLDCSSSTSLALWHEKLFSEDYAWVSGTFASRYGESGEGKFFTVYAHGGHVFVRLHKGKYWRFDTSPHGDGGRGPQLRKLPRSTRGFAARHWPGM